MIMSSLPSSPSAAHVESLLNRSLDLMPNNPRIEAGSTIPPSVVIHLLHLGSEGEILGHVDNLESSGGTIMGICLGADRILRLKKTGAGDDGTVEGWDVLLPGGSVYIQR
jgi:alkylated DNA repair protein alkB family protein 7